MLSLVAAPAFAAKAKGAYLYDADGNEYVDLVCSWGLSIWVMRILWLLRRFSRRWRGERARREAELVELVVNRINAAIPGAIDQCGVWCRPVPRRP